MKKQKTYWAILDTEKGRLVSFFDNGTPTLFNLRKEATNCIPPYMPHKPVKAEITIVGGEA